MADFHWLNPVSANFDTAADWSTGAVPGNLDTAILDAAGSTDYAVTVSSLTTVDALQLSATATLAINGAIFAVIGYEGANPSMVNGGTIAVANGSVLSMGGLQANMSNAGAISLGSSGTQTEIGSTSRAPPYLAAGPFLLATTRKTESSMPRKV